MESFGDVALAISMVTFVYSTL